MTTLKFSLFFRYAVNLVYTLLLFIPYCEVYTPWQSDEWTKIFVYTNDGSLMIFSPFAILWIFFQITKNSKLKKLAKWLCLIITAFYFLGTLGTLLMPIQDYIPKIGSILLLSLFPLIALMLIFEKIERKDLDSELEDILDA